ncbi:MAG: hypothetical protein ABIR04_03240 [Cypionkella sp.]
MLWRQTDDSDAQVITVLQGLGHNSGCCGPKLAQMSQTASRQDAQQWSFCLRKNSNLAIGLQMQLCCIANTQATFADMQLQLLHRSFMDQYLQNILHLRRLILVLVSDWAANWSQGKTVQHTSGCKRQKWRHRADPMPPYRRIRVHNRLESA